MTYGIPGCGHFGDSGGIEGGWTLWLNIPEPYIIHYPRIVAVADEAGNHVEIIEFFDCIGGAMWSKHHYAQSPVVKNVRCVGQTMRYLVTPGTVDLALEGSRFPAGISSCVVGKTEIAVTYIGMGGGGVGAAACRSDAQGVLRSRCDESGGGKVARFHYLAAPHAAGSDWC